MLKRIFGFSLFLCLLFPLVVSAGGEREATEEKPEAARAAEVKPSEYDEAPMLAELVKQASARWGEVAHGSHCGKAPQRNRRIRRHHANVVEQAGAGLDDPQLFQV